MVVNRKQELGIWDVSQGLIGTTQAGTIFSQTGWGSREQLLTAGVGAQGTAIPQLWLCGGDGTLPPVHQRFIVEGTPARLLKRHGYTAGVIYEDDFAEYCLLTGILPPDLTASRPEQTTAVFEEIEATLAEVDMTFADVARTWLYMDRILEWYDDFNQARDAFFRSRQVYDGLVPASTGIGSANLCGAAITACAIAVRPKAPELMQVQAITSPLQCAALEYGSSFSRAVELSTPKARTLMVSGTASIEPGGATVHIDDVQNQIQLTMDVIAAILHSREMDWSDATRAVMYLKKAEYNTLWQAWLKDNHLEHLPLITLEADVCRDDLLVELEVDTVKPA